MALIDKIAGTSSETLQIGLAGNQIKNDPTDGLAVRDEADLVNKNLTVARPQGASADVHASTYLDTKERVFLIEFAFNGGAPPAPGTNTGKYGFCHTSGGGYNAGAIYLDNGVALVAAPIYKMHSLVTTTAITGTVSLIANGVYIAQSGAAPYSWTSKGDGAGTNTGTTKSVKLAITNVAGNFDSTTSIPSGAKILRVYTDIKTAYDGGATISVRINGGTPLTVQATTENRPNKINLYQNTPFADVGGANAGPIRVVLGGAPTVGAADVLVEYNDTSLA